MVFVYLGEELPKYAHASLELAERFSGLDVTLLGNLVLRNQIKKSNIDFVAIEDFYNSKKFMEVASKISLPLSFRNGFWSKTLERFFVLQQYMETYQVPYIFHAELDQILFGCDKLLKSLEEIQFKGVALPFHTIDLGVASVFYCNDIKSLESLLEFANLLPSFHNEMELIAQWAISNPHMVKLLPTIASVEKSNDRYHYSGLEIIPYKTIDGILDARQIGQWLGGQDPRNVNIWTSPKNKYVESSSEEILTYSELSNLELELTSEGSLLILYNRSEVYNLYNVHLHSKIHPWIFKSDQNLRKLIDSSNQLEPIMFLESRRIQISDFFATGIKSISRHPIESIMRFIREFFKWLMKDTFN